MIASKLQELVNVREFVLVNDRVLEQIDMIHCLRQIAKSPARQANILRRLQLIVELEQAGELMVVRGTFAHIVRPLEVLKQVLYLLHLALGVVKVPLILLLLLIVGLISACLLIEVGAVHTVNLHRGLVVPTGHVGLVLPSSLLLCPLFLESVCLKIHYLLNFNFTVYVVVLLD